MRIQLFANNIDFLKSLLSVRDDYIKRQISRLSNHQGYFDFIYSQLSILEKKGVRPNRIGNEEAEIIYSSVKFLRPEHFVETGVAAGFSSACILMGLADNNFGKLYSIDYPNYQSPIKRIKRNLKYKGPFKTFTFKGMRHIGSYFLKKNYHIPNGSQSGWAIPDKLKDSWEVHYGLSRDILPNLLRKLGAIDVFLHDSDHSEENMLYEFRITWPFLRENGIIFSDNVNLNSAFKNFAGEIKVKKVLILKGRFGAILK